MEARARAAHQEITMHPQQRSSLSPGADLLRRDIACMRVSTLVFGSAPENNVRVFQSRYNRRTAAHSPQSNPEEFRDDENLSLIALAFCK